MFALPGQIYVKATLHHSDGKSTINLFILAQWDHDGVLPGKGQFSFFSNGPAYPNLVSGSGLIGSVSINSDGSYTVIGESTTCRGIWSFLIKPNDPNHPICSMRWYTKATPLTTVLCNEHYPAFDHLSNQITLRAPVEF